MGERQSRASGRRLVPTSWRLALLGAIVGSSAIAVEFAKVDEGTRLAAHVFDAGGGTLTGPGLRNATNFGEAFSHPRKMAAGGFVMHPGFLPKKKTPAKTVAVGSSPSPGLETRLRGNFPNPFNPTTTIRYQLARAGAVSLRVYDVNGRLVRTLVRAPGTPGDHTARWDGRSDAGLPLAGGLYFVRLVADGSAHEHKVLLVK